MQNLKAEDFGKPEPRWRSITISREKGIPLAELEKGIRFLATHGPELNVKFAVSKPFPARQGTGWQACKVRSEFGGESVMLLVEGKLSGIVRLRR